jgi:mannose-6-phosphate isomerase-like protein (cupin superfamily)
MIDLLLFNAIKEVLDQSKISIASYDEGRPWGGFLVIDEQCTHDFISLFFPETTIDELGKGKLSPKILFVAPGKKLSWQYHHRREEIWKLIEGVSGIIRSETDQEGPLTEMKKGEIVYLKKNERHRLVGLNHWGVVAEIWKHTNPEIPSDEDDIIRLQDEYGRN